MALSIRGALKWSKRELRDLAKSIVVNGKRRCSTAEDARQFLLDRLSEGKELLPMGKCDGFDYRTGCPGHEEGNG